MKNTRRTIILPIIAGCFIVHAPAQSGTVLIGRYPQTTSSLSYAPGQIATIGVAGLRAISTIPFTQRATSLPLPKSLSGISVTVNQSIVTDRFSAAQPVSSTSAALVSIQQEAVCSDVTAPPFPPECVITLITMQIPFELQYNAIGYPEYLSYIAFSQDGVEGHSFALNLQYDSIHIITLSDTNAEPSVPTSSGAPPVVTHVDGTMVSAKSPANAGEVVVIYAWGLGWTIPSVPTGSATPQTAPTINSPGWNGVQVRFDFTVDAAPSETFDTQLPTIPAYLTPGQVGLYQINVQLPKSFPQVPPCSTTDAAVRSNLTIDLNGGFSYDGAPICVQPPVVN